MIDEATATSSLTIACCEDDPAITRLLDEAFVTSGHTALFARSGAQAVQRFTRDEQIDVLVLDIGLPDMDGRDLCRVLRANGQLAPVMFLSAQGQVHDIVQGFASGGRDYLVKPFAVPELLVRVESLARRPGGADPVRGLRLDPQQFALCNDEETHLLTPTEFRLMAELLANAGRLVRRTDLVAAAWVPGARVNGNTLDTYLHRLRAHLRGLGSDATIQTVRGVGYILRGL